MIVYQYTNIFQVYTVPVSQAVALSHSGSWSESFWSQAEPGAIDTRWARQQAYRSLLLPSTGAIVGYRTQQWTIAGNKLLPGGATSGRQFTPGRNALTTDLPQVALRCNLPALGSPNSSKLTLACIPDEIMKGGEYAPSTAFKTALTLFGNSMIGQGIGFVGRDLAQASVRILSIAGAAITVDAIPGTGLSEGDFIRLKRVTDDTGNPVIGVFRVNTIVGRVLTCGGLDATLTHPSGTLRKDVIAFNLYASLVPIRATVRKVGNPSDRYRGRRSKRRA